CHRYALEEAGTLKILVESEQPHPMLGFTLIASRCRGWRMTDLRSASTASARVAWVATDALDGVAIGMTAPKARIEPGAVPQPVSAPLTRAAISLVVTINPGPQNRTVVRSFCGDVLALARAVDFRNLEAGLSCVLGVGSEAWDRLFGNPRPAELHP